MLAYSLNRPKYFEVSAVTQGFLRKILGFSLSKLYFTGAGCSSDANKAAFCHTMLRSVQNFNLCANILG
jgi:hypothetical protein